MGSTRASRVVFGAPPDTRGRPLEDVLRKSNRSADSHVRVFLPQRCVRADKAVRAPWVCGFAAPSLCVKIYVIRV